MPDAITDVYDQMPPECGREQRRHNKERLAALEAAKAERTRRLDRVRNLSPNGLVSDNEARLCTRSFDVTRLGE